MIANEITHHITFPNKKTLRNNHENKWQPNRMISLWFEIDKISHANALTNHQKIQNQLQIASKF